MTKKEKRFQLSRDDGAYCELSTIDPLAAQEEFGGNLRLNPVGPSFVPGPSLTRPGETLTAHNCPEPSAQPASSKPGFKGSYYVLEVGNFEEEPVATKNTAPDRPTKDRPSTQYDEGVPAAYYMLNMEHFDTEEGKGKGKGKSPSHHTSTSSATSYDNTTTTSPVPCARGGTTYENVAATPPNKYENISVRREKGRSSPLGIPQPTTVVAKGAGVGDHEDTVVRRMSNSLPSQTGEIARGRLCAAAVLAEGSRKNRSHSEISDPDPTGEQVSHPQQRRRRDQIYEATPLSFPKRKSDTAKGTASKEDEIDGMVDGGSVDREKRGEGRKEEGGKEEEGREEGRGESAERPVTIDNEKVEGKSTVEPSAPPPGDVIPDVSEEEGDKAEVVTSEKEGDSEQQREQEALSTKLLESNGLPFAGLVLSSSSHFSEGDLVPVARPRTETIWDDERVESEWSQVTVM